MITVIDDWIQYKRIISFSSLTVGLSDDWARFVDNPKAKINIYHIINEAVQRLNLVTFSIYNDHITNNGDEKFIIRRGEQIIIEGGTICFGSTDSLTIVT